MIRIRIKNLIKIFMILLILISGLIIVEPSLLAQSGSKIESPPITSASIKDGEIVFFEYCSGCHGRRADGRGPQALNLNPKPQNLRNAQFVKYLSDERMYSSISGGVRGTSMPAFELTLLPEKRWDVVHYLRSLTADDTINLPNSIAYQAVLPETINPISLNESSISQGKRIFTNYCANCHGENADGKGIIAPNLIPAPRNLVAITSWGEKPFIDYMSDARLFDSITNGVPGTSMLPWIGVLSEEERWHTISYLRSEAEKQHEKANEIFQ
jgi:mono/diheme cytochrome c family protein